MQNSKLNEYEHDIHQYNANAVSDGYNAAKNIGDRRVHWEPETRLKEKRKTDGEDEKTDNINCKPSDDMGFGYRSFDICDNREHPIFLDLSGSLTGKH